MAEKPNRNFTTADFKAWGSAGGRIGRPRVLTREQALAMAAKSAMVRAENKRAKAERVVNKLEPLSK